MKPFDLAIVGAGPAGMAAAIQARGLGLATIVIDDQPEPGGQIWRAIERRTKAGEAGAFGAAYARGAGHVTRFRASGATYRPNSRVWQIEPGWRVLVSSEGHSDVVEAGSILLATGAQERPAPFPGWTLPGVLTLGGAQILLKTSLQVPTEPVWIAGSGPLVALYAVQLLRLGGQIAGILDTAPTGRSRRARPFIGAALARAPDLIAGIGWIARLRLAGVRIVSDVVNISAEGDTYLRAINFRTSAGRSERVTASVLLVHEGVIPAIHASLAAGCAQVWNPAQLSFRPRTDDRGETSRRGIYAAGDAAGIGGAEAALAQGALAAIAIAEQYGIVDAADARRRIAAAQVRLAGELRLRALLDALYPPRDEIMSPAEDTIICRCEDVTAANVKHVAMIGRLGPNQVKAFTRCGMGPCQGRQCGTTVSHILSDLYGVSMDETGFFRIRPPLQPITVAELAALSEPSE